MLSRTSRTPLAAHLIAAALLSFSAAGIAADPPPLAPFQCDDILKTTQETQERIRAAGQIAVKDSYGTPRTPAAASCVSQLKGLVNAFIAQPVDFENYDAFGGADPLGIGMNLGITSVIEQIAGLVCSMINEKYFRDLLQERPPFEFYY